METFRFGLVLLLELVPLFLLISTLVYLTVEALTPARIQQLLGGRSARSGVPLATALGALTPFCSCSTVPMANGMLRGGVPTSSLVAFLIASPLVSPVAVGVLWSSMGARYALLYCLMAMTLAGVGAIVIGARESRQESTESSEGAGYGCATRAVEEEVAPKRPLADRIRTAFVRSLGDLKKMAVPLLAAVAIGALIHGNVPTDLLLRVAGPDRLWAVPAAALLGVPIYASIVVVLPLGASLLAKGVGLGAVTAFMMAASGFSIPEGVMLARILPARLLARIVVVFTAGVMLIGYLFQLFPSP